MLETELAAILCAPQPDAGSVTCRCEHPGAARCWRMWEGNQHRSGKTEKAPGSIQKVRPDKWEVSKQKAKTKDWNEMNSVKREKNISGQRNSKKAGSWWAQFHQQTCFIWPQSWLMFKDQNSCCNLKLLFFFKNQNDAYIKADSWKRAECIKSLKMCCGWNIMCNRKSEDVIMSKSWRLLNAILRSMNFSLRATKAIKVL